MNILGVSNLLTAAKEVTNEVSTELSLADKGVASAKVVLTGFVVVFAMLLLLILIIKIYSGIVSAAQNSAKKKKEAKSAKSAEIKAQKPVSEAPKATVAATAATDNGGISDEIVAVISAAVATMYGSSEKVRIKSIKKSGGRSAWANAGILDNTRPF